jgi:hypothetical protein
MTYQPSSYTVLVADAVRALQAALADGERLLEIEFPPLPTAKDGACDVAHLHQPRLTPRLLRRSLYGRLGAVH